VGFPSARLPLAVLSRILEGGLAKCREAGIAVCGGHSVEDLEPKFGLAVFGTCEQARKRMWRNNTGRGGDRLFLSKPLGTGVLSTALKKGLLRERPGVEAALVASMSKLNKGAMESAKALEKEKLIEVHAATDVTGFGLLGHLREMLTKTGDAPAGQADAAAAAAAGTRGAARVVH
jgi:selenide,water dikinase